MPYEAVKYTNGKPEIQDGLQVDSNPVHCGKWAAEYRLHYSAREKNSLPRIRACFESMQKRLTKKCPIHPPMLAVPLVPFE
jgi:hypothetical protein